ncbi:hypothetical protein [Bacillus sp. FSL R9-9410]|uniref:hypothetical protein n=1 Tax=Bacillus sp. FSL R9-9410 TaxID=2921590 RepID=UPI003100BBB4
MKKILLAITSIAFIAVVVFTSTDNKEQPNQIVKEDTQHLLVRMSDPGGGMG